MASESILVVDDTPVSLKLTRILLINAGFTVHTAGSPEQALDALRAHRPRLILANARLPELADLTRTARQESSGGIVIIAFAAAGDERRAIDADCDGFVARPANARTLAAQLREFLDKHSFAASATTESDVSDLRSRFLSEGLEKGSRMLESLDGRFDAAQASKTVHQWIGAGGMLGYLAISRLCREVEGLMQERPLDNAQLRVSLSRLIAAFRSPEEKQDESLPQSVVEALSGKRIGLIGFSPSDAWQVCTALDQVQAATVPFDASAAPDSEAVLECDVLMLQVGPDAAQNRWLDPAAPGYAPRPLVFVGGRDQLLGLDRTVQGRAREFLLEGWKPEEALLRLSFALSPVPEAVPNTAHVAGFRGTEGRPEVVVADDDATVLMLVRLALQNYGMDCRLVSNGPDALEAIRKYRPQAAVLDVNMPGMNGYEVLAAVRGEDIPTRILLLTARQQENDVVRGFTLGADDYVVKPFSPMELVARLKRLLCR